jgi:hypothetical protein
VTLSCLHLLPRNFAGRHSLMSRHHQAVHAQLQKQPTVLMYSGRELFEESDIPHRSLLEQAVDFGHFARVGPRS